MSKRASLTIKGVAIILMLVTHFLDFQQPTNLITFQIGSRNFDSYLGYAASICVAIFAFINGYGIAASIGQKQTLCEKALYILKKAIVFLLEYWVIVFSLFLPFYLAAGKTMSVDLFLQTLIGYGGIHGFAWYVWFYLIILIAVPIIATVLPKKLPWWLGCILAYIPLTLVIVVLAIVDKNDQLDSIRGYLCHGISVLGGVVFWKYGVFGKAKALLCRAKLNHWWFYLLLSLIGLALLAIFRRGIIAPYALLPIIFLWTDIMDEHRPPRPILFALSWLGILSMPIWFIHYAFFAGYVNQFIPLFDFVSSLRIGIFISLFALLLCIPVALAYHFLFQDAKIAFKRIADAKDAKQL